jgi:hypothetical protein
MPLVPATLEQQLNTAFLEAMKEFLKFQQSGNKAKDKSNQAMKAAASVFGKKAGTAIDSYIKSGTVTTAVVTAGTIGAHTGTGTGAVL